MIYIVKQKKILNRAFINIDDAKEYIKIFQDRSHCKCHICKHVYNMQNEYGHETIKCYDIMEVPDAEYTNDSIHLFILFKNKEVISTSASYKTIHDIFRQNIRYKDYVLKPDKYKIVFCPLSVKYDCTKHYEYNTDYHITIYRGDDQNYNWGDHYFINNEL